MVGPPVVTPSATWRSPSSPYFPSHLLFPWDRPLPLCLQLCSTVEGNTAAAGSEAAWGGGSLETLLWLLQPGETVGEALEAPTHVSFDLGAGSERWRGCQKLGFSRLEKPVRSLQSPPPHTVSPTLEVCQKDGGGGSKYFLLASPAWRTWQEVFKPSPNRIIFSLLQREKNTGYVPASP